MLSITTKKTKISEVYLVRENVKSLSNSVTKFCDQEICEEFHFFRHLFSLLILLFLVVYTRFNNSAFLKALLVQTRIIALKENRYLTQFFTSFF